MKINLAQLKKVELVKMFNGRCKHGHRFVEHPDCYIREQEHPVRIGFFDIEASNLKADFGIIVSYSILSNTNEYFGDVITEEDLDRTLDKRIVEKMVNDLRQFDLIVGYYSTKYDIPYARTRAHVQGLKFPVYGEIQHKDVYYMIRNKFALSRNSQENAARLLVGKTEKTRMKPELWVRALGGDKASLDYIFEHNQRDVRDLKRLYNAVIPYVKNISKSI